MEGEKKAKLFVCKFCHKRYPCGKSLGGHIRTHTINSSAHYQHRRVVAEEEEEEEENSRAINKVVNLHFLAGGKKIRTSTTITTTTDHHGDSNVSGYVLRENPKKTRRFNADDRPSKCLNFQQDQKVICKECGKGFQSLKALCGHMAYHSHDREKGVGAVHVNNNMIEENLSSSTDQYHHNHNQKKMQIVMDIQSETETWISKGGGEKMRHNEKSSCLDNDFANGSSSMSNIEQEEQDVVMCLMMLSRDHSSINNYCKWGQNSVTESSDTNSVILETKSSSTGHQHNQMRGIAKEKISTLPCTNGDGGLEEEVKKKGKLKADDFIHFYHNSDSRYVQNGSKFSEFDASQNGFHKFHELKKLRVKCGSGFVTNEAKLESELEEQAKNRFCPSSKYELRNRAKSVNAPNGIEFSESSVKKMKMMTITNDPSGDDIYGTVTEKGQGFKCSTCNKMFDSHRALGGHKASHRRINGWYESTNEGGENIIETSNARPIDYHKVPESGLNVIDSFSAKDVIIERGLGSKKKTKRYKCPICFKVYRSGQALGGHKKSHFIGGSDQDNRKVAVVKKEEEEEEQEEEGKGVRGFIDLNLPAPLEEEEEEEKD